MKSPTTISATGWPDAAAAGSGVGREPVEQEAHLLSPDGVVGHLVVEVQVHEGQAGRARWPPDASGRAAVAQLEPGRSPERQGAPGPMIELPYSGRPAQARRAGSGPRRRLPISRSCSSGRRRPPGARARPAGGAAKSRQQEGQALVPAIGQVADVEGGDVEAGHPGSRAASAIGRANENVEPRPSSDTTQIRPPWASITCRAIARPEARAAAPDPGPVDLVEALEDALLRAARDADPVVLDRHDHGRASPAASTRTATSPPSGLNFTALWTRLTITWPSRSSAPRTGGHARVGDIDAELDALALGEQAQPVGRGGRQAAQVDLIEEEHRPARLDPGEVEQLADHLDEVAGLDLDPADPIAHPRRNLLTGRLRFADQGLGQEARRWSAACAARATGCRRTRSGSAAGGAARRRPRGSATWPRPSAARRARTTSDRPSAERRVSSPLAAPVSAAVSASSSIRRSMNASIRLRPTSAAGRPTGEDVGRRIGVADDQVDVQADDPDRQAFGQDRRSSLCVDHRQLLVASRSEDRTAGPARTH